MLSNQLLARQLLLVVTSCHLVCIVVVVVVLIPCVVIITNMGGFDSGTYRSHKDTLGRLSCPQRQPTRILTKRDW